MKQPWKLLAALVAAFFLAGAVPVLAADVKIGVVDLQRCLNDSKLGKQFKVEFTAEAEQLKTDLEREEAELKSLREEIEKQGVVLSETAKKEREAAYNQRLDAFKGRFKESQQSLQRKDQELTRKVLKGLQGIISDLGGSGGYTLIVEKQEAGVIYMSQASDITDEVIRRYDLGVGQE